MSVLESSAIESIPAVRELVQKAEHVLSLRKRPSGRRLSLRKNRTHVFFLRERRRRKGDTWNVISTRSRLARDQCLAFFSLDIPSFGTSDLRKSGLILRKSGALLNFWLAIQLPPNKKSLLKERTLLRKVGAQSDFDLMYSSFVVKTLQAPLWVQCGGNPIFGLKKLDVAASFDIWSLWDSLVDNSEKGKDAGIVFWSGCYRHQRKATFAFLWSHGGRFQPFQKKKQVFKPQHLRRHEEKLYCGTHTLMATSRSCFVAMQVTKGTELASAISRISHTVFQTLEREFKKTKATSVLDSRKLQEAAVMRGSGQLRSGLYVRPCSAPFLQPIESTPTLIGKRSDFHQLIKQRWNAWCGAEFDRNDDRGEVQTGGAWSVSDCFWNQSVWFLYLPFCTDSLLGVSGSGLGYSTPLILLRVLNFREVSPVFNLPMKMPQFVNWAYFRVVATRISEVGCRS